MGLARPTGEYAEQMLAPNGWPEADEDASDDRAQQYIQVLRQAAEVLDSCRREQLEIFEGDVWSGGAANAADGQLGTNIDALTTLLDGLATVITWHRHIAESVLQAKLDINDNVESAHEQIRALENNSKLNAAQRTSAITAVVTAARGANTDVVIMAAARILATRAWKPPDTALQDLLDQKMPPPDESPPASPTPGDEVPSETDPALPGPGVPPPAGPRIPPRGGPAVPPPVGPARPQPGIPAGVLPSNPGAPGLSPVSATPAAGMPSPTRPATAPTAPVTPGNPAASTPSEGSNDGDAGSAGPGVTEPHSARGEQDTSPRVAPASATGMPAMPMAPAAAGGGGGGGAGAAPASGAGSGGTGVSAMGGSARRTPPGNGVRPAATRGQAARRDSAAHRKSTDQSVEGAAMAAIPVSAARIERDAIAEAATADAARRRGPDRLQLARRIAAALNAPVDDKEQEFGFFWVTGLTTEGAIVVANSYGLAYIPEGVQLPEQVFMATADDAIPAAERARWSTYPALAVQGWAAHRDAKLRAVIATAEQLADSDLGAAKVVLKPDDIPASGEMIGRSRLEVVDPEAAARLAQTPDARLLALLPPAPAQADPPADDRFMLWIQVLKPMIHDDPRRQEPHLKAFHAYATHAQEVVANEARTGVDPVAQRCAVGDWLYWKHLTRILQAALSPAELSVREGAPISSST
jgi:hypothetical protein